MRVEHKTNPLWRRLLVALTLIIFAQAGYVTQTHIHPVALTAGVAGDTSHSKVPSRDDPQHCPICQEFLVAGAYVVPVPIVLPLPVAVPSFGRIAHREFSFLIEFAHAWQSRAPPRT